MASANCRRIASAARSSCRERRFGSLAPVESDCMNATYSPRRLLYQLVATFSVLVVVGAMLLPPAPPAYAAPSTTIVISGFRTRGPLGGNDEFVELFNKSAGPVNVGGWKINASNNAGTTGTRVTITAGTTL